MHPLWQTGIGKLIMGGCGLQVGMLFSLGSLVVMSLLCVICISFNFLSIGLTQPIFMNKPAVNDPEVVVVAQPLSEEEILLTEINSLLTKVDLLQPETSDSVDTPSLANVQMVIIGNPLATATQPGTDIYSGPGSNYDKVGTLSPGQSLNITGRNSDESWWLVAMPNGLFAWVSNVAVVASNVNETIPVVTLPSALTEADSNTASGNLPGTSATPTLTPTVTATPTPALPPGTPTPLPEDERVYVEALPIYKRIKGNLMVPPVSSSISPDGSRIGVTERIKVYIIAVDGGHTDILFEDNNDMGPLGGIVWSPDGQHLAFLMGFKQKYCKPCRAVVIVNMLDNTMMFLEPPGDMDTDSPRWTQDGRLLVNAHPGESADGVAYVYNIYGESQIAEGTYYLSSSHEGQKSYPWLPGRVWRAGVSERADSYNSD